MRDVRRALFTRTARFLRETLPSFHACTQPLAHCVGPCFPPPTGPRQRAGICSGGVAVDGEGRRVRRGCLGELRPPSVSHARNPATPTEDVSELGSIKSVSHPVFDETEKIVQVSRRVRSLHMNAGRFSVHRVHERASTYPQGRHR